MVLLMCALLSLLQAKTQLRTTVLNAQYLYAGQYGPEASNCFTAVANPATLPDVNGFSVALQSEKRFLLKEFQSVTACAALRNHNNGFAVLAQYAGTVLFNEKIIGATYGKSLGKVSLGALFQYYMYAANQRLTRFGLSSVWKITDQVFTSFSCINPHQAVSASSISAPAVFQMGVGWQLSQQVYIGAESQKEDEKPPQIIMVLSYKPSTSLRCKAVWSTGSQQVFFASGWKWNDIMIEIGAGIHQVLGPSPTLAIIFQKNHH